MFGGNEVTVDHKKDGWYISFKFTDKRILSLLEVSKDAIMLACDTEMFFNVCNDSGKNNICKKRKGLVRGLD